MWEFLLHKIANALRLIALAISPVPRQYNYYMRHVGAPRHTRDNFAPKHYFKQLQSALLHPEADR